MKRSILMAGTWALAACGQSSDNASERMTARPKKARPPYCFFKDTETKDWKVSRDKDGNIVLKGKAFRLDSRYMAVLGHPVVTGNSAEIRPSITVNDTGYGAPDNWWDLRATIPNSAALDTVDVRCGEKTVAELKVAPKG